MEPTKKQNSIYSKPKSVMKTRRGDKLLHILPLVLFASLWKNWQSLFKAILTPENSNGRSSVQMALRDYTYFEIRDILQLSVGFISKWKQTFEARGVAGLLLQYQGSSGYLERKQQQDVIDWLNQKNYWNLRELQQYVEDTYNVIFASKQSYYDIFKVAGIS